MTQSEIEYREMDLHDHILKRPDTYVGSMEVQEKQEFVLGEEKRIVKKAISTCGAFTRIFVEIISNAVDNYLRSKNTDMPCTKIQITIGEDGTISCQNNGQGIPICANEHGIYNGELIFGKLLTSSNYDDTKDRDTSGRNGYGAKLTNIFSTFFKIEIHDVSRQLKYEQTWTDNMKNKTEPTIKKMKCKENSIRIEYRPDYELLKTIVNSDYVSLFSKYVYDVSFLTGNDVQVSLNGEKIKLKTIQNYANLYNDTTQSIALCDTDQLSVIIKNSQKEASQISFVNGIQTPAGGVHVDEVVEKVLRPIMKTLSKKGITVTIKELKSRLDIFLKCSVVNPTFNSQSKEKLTSPKVVMQPITDAQIKKVLQWDFVTELKKMEELKDLKKSKATDSKKRASRVDGLDSANFAGGKRSMECTLILCEGLSAKTYAVHGIEKGIENRKGRDFFGIYPLKGKLLNVRNSSPAQIQNNKELSDLKVALNLKHGVDYCNDDNFKTLNYGKIMIMTDADVDGLHIEGLIINFFDVTFPSLLSRNFLISMKTPIVTVSKSITSAAASQKVFYDERLYQQESHTVANDKAYIKYYKGLGTSTREEILENFGKKILSYNAEENCRTSVDKVFNSKSSNLRKEWLISYIQSPTFSNVKESLCESNIVRHNVSIHDFIDEIMIQYAIEDFSRSLPSLMDGFKISHRKVIHAMIMRSSSIPIKVAQWAGYIAEKTHYKHGEQCLQDTIIKMAQCYVGSNNVPILESKGQFGSRLCGGKDAASGRYIYTNIKQLAKLFFKDTDKPILDYCIEENHQTEPRFFTPPIPFVLVNGCSCGIGTGWSSFIPNYKPEDVFNATLACITNKPIPEITPWYKGFNGTILPVQPGVYITKGIYSDNGSTITITELPIGLWTDKYKSWLDDCENKHIIKKYTNNSTVDTVTFTITKNSISDIFDHSTLNLQTHIKTTNMTLLNEDGLPVTYNSPLDIIQDFCKVRLAFYTKRKNYLLSDLSTKKNKMTQEELFITKVLQKHITFENMEQDLIDDDELSSIDGSYDHFLNLPVKSFTNKKIEKLQENINNISEQLSTLHSTSNTELWINDIQALQTVF